MTQTAPVRPYVRGEADGDALWFLGNLVTIKTTGAETRGRLTVAEFVNPPGFAAPLHRHLKEDELFYLLSGTARFRCDGEDLSAGPGDLVFLPVGLAHTFTVGPDEPLRVLQITTPSGFEDFAATVGEPARERRLPTPAPVDPTVLGHAAAQHAIEILGPPPEE
ncbi:cupin domain-containing protein [Streptosporangium roseum]|uniref:cupin domain-containing protein n=1 Tax=Streptosporangium roseum TaxID=2001 RepID=UPI003331DBE9